MVAVRRADGQGSGYGMGMGGGDFFFSLEEQIGRAHV